jgi:pimeloyl-ACP methyl ester carboxylesterase
MPQPFSQASIVAALLAALAALQLRTCCVFGHSWGGALALMAEAQQPGTFAAIYCYEPVVTLPGGPGSARQTRRVLAQLCPEPPRSAGPHSAQAQRGTGGNEPLAPVCCCRRTHAGPETSAPAASGSPEQQLRPAAIAQYTGTQHSSQQAQPPRASRSPAQQVSASAAGAAGSGPRRWANPLAALSSKRRGSFQSREAAAHSLGAKPPFSSLHPTCLADYLEGGLQLQDEQQEGSSTRGCSGSGPWRLVCRPEVEALVFEAYFPLPVPDLSRVRCLARVASGEGTPGMHQVLFLAADAVAQGLGAQRVAFSGLGHLGPLEAPGCVGADLLRFLLGAVGAAGGRAAVEGQAVSKL